MQALLGITVLLFLAWLLSENRQIIDKRMIGVGLFIQFVLAFIFLHITWVAELLLLANQVVVAIEQATRSGTMFLFGYLSGAQTPFDISRENALFLFAFNVLPQIVVISVIIAILWHWRILPAIVRGMGWLLRRSLGVSGPLATSGAASVFLGMVETPMVVRAYLNDMSRSELFTVMTFGMSTVAGSVMVLYASLLNDVIPGVVGHILGASVINIIGAIYISRLIIPHRTEHTVLETKTSLKFSSTMDAITRGTSDGLSLAMNVGAMLLVLISLVALINGMLSFVHLDGESTLSLQIIFGWIFAPFAWLIGIPWAEAQTAGQLLGAKVVLNEVVAFLQLSELGDGLSADSKLIMLYALCGFANFGSLGILLGGLTTLIPERRLECLEIAPKSLISGTFVTLMSAAIVAMVSLI